MKKIGQFIIVIYKYLSCYYSDYITPVNSRSSTPTPSWDKMTSITSNTELEFRKDLATLDADIARLQIHFNVSKQNE